jgi:hypothetical protein
MKHAVLLLILPFVGVCQNPVADGLRNGIRLGTAVREAARIQAETELLRAQQELTRKQTELLNRTSAQPKDSEYPVSDEEFNKAVSEVLARYPDFWGYRLQMVGLMGSFKPGRVSIPDYLEGVYLIAKHASFARPPSADKSSPERGADDAERR